jgi:hypothetical protein
MSEELERSLDGEIYPGGSKAPPPPTYASGRRNDVENAMWGEHVRYSYEQDPKVEDVLYERTLARWKDPTTPPHSRQQCVKMCSSKFPPARWCCGWRLQYRWLYRTAVLRVTTSTQVNIGAVVEDCLKETAVITASRGSRQCSDEELLGREAWRGALVCRHFVAQPSW